MPLDSFISLMGKIKLILEDGTTFSGKSFGAEKSVSGEVVFNTGMVGYPESLTDPSYHGQILALTYPLIGNYGVPRNKIEEGLVNNFESEKIHISSLIISDYSLQHSHWSAVKSLSDWLKEHEVPGIYGVDTRKLTKKLREKGVMLGKIIHESDDIEMQDPNRRNLVAEVSIKEPIVYKKGEKKIVLVDCGVKNNIIRNLLKRNLTVIRVPWNYNFLEEVKDFQGVIVSNGPGDPKMAKETISNIKEAMKKEIPIWGICLGNQILALAAGADTYKLKYGHRSQNQPCIEVGSKRCYITSQNHGYAVNSKSLSPEWEEWFVNANDNTNEGIKHKSKPFISIQFHPEASPGPADAEFLFDKMIEML